MTDKLSARPEDVPLQEELNPLLNPLLEQNLSRWARVYFTASPEARDQAVYELLNQLRSEEKANVQEAAVPADPPPLAPLVCATCNLQNPPQQKFCGFCGATLTSQEAPQRPDTARAEAPSDSGPEILSFLGLDSSQPDHELQFLRGKSFGSDYYDTEPVSHRGRYLAIVAVILLAGMAYVERPFLRSHLQSFLTPAPSAQPSAAGAPAAAPQPPSTPAPAAAQQSAGNAPQSQALEPVKSEPQPEAAEDVAAPVTSNGAKQNLDRVQPPAPTAPAPGAENPLTLASQTQPANPVQPGTQELLEAQHYLQGNNSRQAALWLWKAVAQQNSHADLLLADLYRRGDGVPKSCDQARILLIAAAEKNTPGAAAMLRNIESGGCP